ncbi:unnamed protein product [Scytosiphon promiscuus]
MTSGRWIGRAKGVNNQCPHPESKHYCHGKCKICYMKEYNQKTRVLAAEGKQPTTGSRPGRKPATPTATGDTIFRHSSQSAPFSDLIFRPAGDKNASTTSRPGRRRAGTESSTTASSSALTDASRRRGNANSEADKNWRRMVSSCEHADAPHYGKGFCRPCYMVRVGEAGIVREEGGGHSGEAAQQKPSSFRASKSAHIKTAAFRPGNSPIFAGLVVLPDAYTSNPIRPPKKIVGGNRISVSFSRTTTALPPPVCAHCKQTEKSWPSVLICDGCEATFHLGCMRLSSQPFGEWFCARCTSFLLDEDSDTDDGNQQYSRLQRPPPLAAGAASAVASSTISRPEATDDADATVAAALVALSGEATLPAKYGPPAGPGGTRVSSGPSPSESLLGSDGGVGGTAESGAPPSASLVSRPPPAAATTRGRERAALGAPETRRSGVGSGAADSTADARRRKAPTLPGAEARDSPTRGGPSRETCEGAGARTACPSCSRAAALARRRPPCSSSPPTRGTCLPPRSRKGCSTPRSPCGAGVSASSGGGSSDPRATRTP